MIPLTDAGWQGQSWQWQLSNCVDDINKLVSLLGLPAAQALPAQDFPMRVPLPFIARMERGNPHDPLLRQVLPVSDEQVLRPGYTKDPLLERSNDGPAGLLHKYHGRALVIASGACAVNCRYCFRRHFPYDEVQPDSASWEKIFDHLRAEPDINEVILSGGDPMVLSDKRLALIAARLEAIAHVRTLRIHTRLPVVIPQRVCRSMTDWISRTSMNVVVVLHCNHAREIDSEVCAAATRLRDAGATLLNQSVLLRGVNDNVPALVALSERLIEAQILPYYLHLLDPVEGAAHFDVPEPEALCLMRELTGRLPGYLVPRLVREVPGKPAKDQRFWIT